MLCGLLSCAAAPPPKYVYAYTNNKPADYHTITFLAYHGGTVVDEKGTKSPGGHASISINREGVWGFYPNPRGKPVTKHGELVYSTVYPREQEYAEFIVDADILADIEALINEWENSPPLFAVPVNDCVSFINRVCDRVGLRYNPFAILPVTAIQSIRDGNDQTRIFTKKHGG